MRTCAPSALQSVSAPVSQRPQLKDGFNTEFYINTEGNPLRKSVRDLHSRKARDTHTLFRATRSPVRGAWPPARLALGSGIQNSQKL